MSTKALQLFFSTATQYYVTGRFAVLVRQSPVAGNLLHHAIEMYLKGGLARTTTLQDLEKFGHSLPKLWSAFKVRFPNPGLNSFDKLVSSLNAFEDLRYPDSVLAQGMSVVMGVVRTPLPLSGAVARTEPKYELYLDELDALVRKLFEVASVKPALFLDGLQPKAREYLTEANAQSWEDTMHQEPNEQTQGKTGEQVKYEGSYAAVGCCRKRRKLGQNGKFPVCPQHGNTTWGWIPKPSESDMKTSLEDARFFYEKLNLIIRGPEQGQDLELIRRYFRAYLHCWKCVPHFVREVKELKKDTAWDAWTKKWALGLDTSDYEVFESLRNTRDHDTHVGMIKVNGEIAAGLFPIVVFQPGKGSGPRRELISCCDRGLFVADHLIREHPSV